MESTEIPQMPTNSISNLPGFEPAANYQEGDGNAVEGLNSQAIDHGKSSKKLPGGIPEYETHTHTEELFTPDVATPIQESINSHGINLLMTDNNIEFDEYLDPSIVAAAYDQNHAII